MKTLRITSVKPVPGSTDPGGKVVLKYEVETDDGAMFLHFTQKAADDLKKYLDTPVTSMRLGGNFKP